MKTEEWPIEDLFLVPSEDGREEDGSILSCVYSKRVDAVTFVSKDDADKLKAQGAKVLPELPDDGAP